MDKRIENLQDVLDVYVRKFILPQATEATNNHTYGVGGMLINLNTKEVIVSLRNRVIYRENDSEKYRLHDPTAHGERQLIDWYYENKAGLPQPKDILLVTTLDPCCMCTGSILSSGFQVVVVALDSSAGINWDNTYTFSPFKGDMHSKLTNLFIYPPVVGDESRKGFGKVPLFESKELTLETTKECLDVFVKGAVEAREIAGKIIPKKDIKNILNAPQNIIDALKKECPQALTYTCRPGKPDVNIADILKQAILEDKRYGGNGDAVAFIDCHGNLLMCKAGRKSLSPIRTAYMETVRAYQKVRYELSSHNDEALYYLCDPKFGTFVMVRSYDKTAQSFVDLGAYGSTIFGGLDEDTPDNLQYIVYQLDDPDELKNYINGMPPLYPPLLKPKQVEDQRLIDEITKFLK